MTTLHVVADLSFEMTLTEADGHESRHVTGRLRGEGRALELEVSDAAAFAGRGDAGFIRGLAEGLARRGLTLTVVSPQGPLVTLGTRAGWLQRRVTGSRHMRVVGAGAAIAAARARKAAPALPTAAMAPPGTMLPLAPTFLRRPRVVTTTHDPAQGGDPRLVEAMREDWWPGDTRAVHHLRQEVTVLGSADDCDVAVPGLEPYAAEVRHDDEDEYVLVRLGTPGTVRVNGEPVAARTLRTGSRVTLGERTFTFVREEYADHGRPYGGRIGGELGHQKPQPPRQRVSPTPDRKAPWPTP